MNRLKHLQSIALGVFASGLLCLPVVEQVEAEISGKTMADFAAYPPAITSSAPPLVMLILSRDHRLYYEAYNDASDLDSDGTLDTTYKPDEIDYYGYFDSHKCYDYDSSQSRFNPISVTANKQCSGHWSGDFLNYITMSRMDALRKVLYGGYRAIDDAGLTILERSHIPQDAHSWAKEYNGLEDDYDITHYTPLALPSEGSRHLFGNTTLLQSGNGEPRLRILTNVTHRVWEWASKERPVVHTDTSTGASVSPTDYIVRVKVCDSTMPEDNCKLYPNNDYKPTGLLHRYGENDTLMFGLLTGSYTNNTQGGVLRKNVASIRDEIDSNTGQLTGTNGIIRSIDRFRTVGFDGNYEYSCGWITTRPINNGECRMWGNPVAEMLYETLRYFSGQASPTSEFVANVGDSGSDDTQLGLPLASWIDPYDERVGGFPWCARPISLILSDINTSYDSDRVPGTFFGSYQGDLGGIDVSSLGDTIWNQEFGLGATKSIYIGQSGSDYDGAPSPKQANSFASIRGLSPEEPTKEGSYYSASVAHYGHVTDLRSSTAGASDLPGEQSMQNYTVALASPLPRISIPIGSRSLTLVPFAKSVGGSYGITPTHSFQPTNQIVDFYVETIKNTDPTNQDDGVNGGRAYGKFRINYEDVEQGADHDMDAIVEYEFTVNADSTIDIALNSTYAAGSIQQHIGYIISGTTADGTYLEVRDRDTDADSDTDYFLDTPPGQLPGGVWNDAQPLPLTTTRTFKPGDTAAASVLKDPLWYTAKWGGFTDLNGNNVPDQQAEWDTLNASGQTTPDGIPDNYFLVANPLGLEKTLNRVFSMIAAQVASGTATAVVANSQQGIGAVYQALYEPSRSDGNREVQWIGTLHGLWADDEGHIREDNGNQQLGDYSEDPVIEIYYDTTDKKTYFRRYSPNDTANPHVLDLATAPHTDKLGFSDLRTLWNARERLSEVTDPVNQRSNYSDTSTAQRYILTWLDGDYDDVVDSGEVVQFKSANFNSTNVGWLDLAETPVTSANVSEAQDLVDYVRGKEITGMRSRTLDYDGDGNDEPVLLGDIVHSTPTVVGAPAEALDLVYGDASYAEFRKHYANRRQMVYVGSNDGMIHAFNGGFFNAASSSFTKSGFNNETAYELGTELWAYVPKNVLGQLKYLNDPNYKHIYFVDGQPRVFDAKIFTPDSDHPQGWGTVMVIGMRLGGAPVTVDTAGDGLGGDHSNDDVTLGSAYVVMDITNPEQPPEVLAEIRYPNLGFTTSFPSVVSIVDDANSLNEWFLVFGSGPTELATATSNQNARFFIYDLNSLQLDREHDIGIAGSFVGDPVTVDWDLDQKADNVYFGLISGSAVNPGGALERIAVAGNADPSQWAFTTLVNPGQPFLARPVVSIDKQGNHWILAGTGRFLTDADKTSTDQQTLYGLMDDGSSNDPMVALSDLVDVSDAYIDEDGDVAGSVAGLTTPDDASALQQHILNHKGWKKDLTFPSGESSFRQVNAAALLGGTLFVPAYQPDNSLCTAEGTSRLYALDFRSGVSSQALGVDNISSPTKYLEYVDLEAGLSSSPSLHLNATPGKLSKLSVFTQQSTGAISDTDATVAGGARSGEISWREMIW